MHLLRVLALAADLTAVLCLAESLGSTVHMTISDSKPPTPKYYAHVVGDGLYCEYPDSTMPMCANKDFVCRMPPGEEMAATAPSCLAYDPSNMQDNPFEIEETAVAPWEVCDLEAEHSRKIGDPPICKREFQCMCLHGASESCVCAPADAVADSIEAAKCGNATGVCADDKYCHYLQTDGVECGKKPYYS